MFFLVDNKTKQEKKTGRMRYSCFPGNSKALIAALGYFTPFCFVWITVECSNVDVGLCQVECVMMAMLLELCVSINKPRVPCLPAMMRPAARGIGEKKRKEKDKTKKQKKKKRSCLACKAIIIQ